MLVDIALLLIIAFFTLRYYKRGLAVSLLGVARIISSFSVSAVMCGRLSAALSELFLRNAAKRAVSMLISKIEFGEGALSADGFISVAGNFFSIEEGLDIQDLKEAFTEILSFRISEITSYALAFIILFSIVFR